MLGIKWHRSPAGSLCSQKTDGWRRVCTPVDSGVCACGACVPMHVLFGPIALGCAVCVHMDMQCVLTRAVLWLSVCVCRSRKGTCTHSGLEPRVTWPRDPAPLWPSSPNPQNCLPLASRPCGHFCSNPPLAQRTHMHFVFSLKSTSHS